MKLWQLYKNTGDEDYIEEYRKRSILTGKEVVLISGENRRCVKVKDIDKKCRLVIENEQGEEEIVLSGEVSVRL